MFKIDFFSKKYKKYVKNANLVKKYGDMNLEIKKYALKFKFPAGTSRGILMEKVSWFLILRDDKNSGFRAIGECGLLPKLSFDDKPQYHDVLLNIKNFVEKNNSLDFDGDLSPWPSIRFGMEMLKKSYESGDGFLLFDNDFVKGKKPVEINGLIWMGDKSFMFEQIKRKIDEGWRCIKMKIGAIDFDDELDLLKYIRRHFDEDDLELRVDANGAFSPESALDKLKRLSDYHLHSIEQPIMAGQVDTMAYLCENSPLDIALDEELIGLHTAGQKYKLLKAVKPKYIILKPSLTGGWQASEEWIDIAENLDIGFWVTSALESNVGLNAIAQWTANMDKDIVHGLGTGQLYENNFKSPLVVQKGFLHYDNNLKWSIDL